MKYRITRRVDLVVGSQTYLVDAENPKDALDKYDRGESEWEADELEIQSFEGKPEVEEVEVEPPQKPA